MDDVKQTRGSAVEVHPSAVPASMDQGGSFTEHILRIVDRKLSEESKKEKVKA